MLTVVTAFWDANAKSPHFSRCYDETWVEKLYRGFARNLSFPFRFVCFTERDRKFAHPEIEQERLVSTEPAYSDGIEVYRLDGPLIVVGLDTVIVGKIDHFLVYCETIETIAILRDPYLPRRRCNGVVLAPKGHKVMEGWKGQADMGWLAARPHTLIDDVFPGQVVSYKVHVKRHGLGDARIVYFHGEEKPHEVQEQPVGAWIKEHWR